MNYTSKFRMECLERKVKFVEGINSIFENRDTGTSVSKVEYKVFGIPTGTPDKDGNNPVFIQEYLVVTYEGGAIAARNCNGNSRSAIFKELAALLNGGYYDEVKAYREAEAESQEFVGIEIEE